MNIFRNLILGAVALGGFALATPAQAHDHYYYHHHYYHYGPRVGVTFGAPYAYDPYYDYGYYRPYPYYGYSYGPGVSFAWGGHRHYYHYGGHHYYYHHHH
jgi:son of sevenless-like protein